MLGTRAAQVPRHPRRHPVSNRVGSHTPNRRTLRDRKEVRGSRPEIRLAIRQARARPVVEDLRAWFDATLQTLSAKSEMAGAVRYAISRWTALTRYLDDGTFEIDNNAAERALRV